MDCDDLKRIIKEYKSGAALSKESFEQLLKQVVEHHDEVCDTCGEQLGESFE